MYEKLLKEAEKERIEVYEINFKGNIKGLYSDNVIGINKNLSNKDKICIIAEELGHHYRSYGDILDQRDTTNRKEERRARIWAYKRLVGITDLVNAFNAGVKNRYELSEYLNVTESFIEEAVNYYHEKHGEYIIIDNYTVYFSPLAVMEIWER